MKYLLENGCATEFETLKDAKAHYDFYSDKEKEESVGEFILGVRNGETVSATEVKAFKNGRLYFGKTHRN